MLQPYIESVTTLSDTDKQYVGFYYFAYPFNFHFFVSSFSQSYIVFFLYFIF